MTFNLQCYLHGTVTLKVSGPMPEKFINLCMIEKRYILSISKKDNEFIICMRLKDFFLIRPLVRKSQNRIQVIDYWGLPFLTRRIKKRKMLVVGGVLFLLVIQLLMSYIWFVDIVGTKDVPVGKIKDCVYQYGLKPGVIKDEINVKFIENQLLLNIPEVAWVSVNFTGTRAVVEIVEKTMPKEVDKAPGDIVAGKDGVIIEVIALAGQSQVKKGDTVKKGDVLIKGVVGLPKEETEGTTNLAEMRPQLIRANGIVKGRVWYEGYGESELLTVSHVRTGQQKMGITLRVFEHEFHIKPVGIADDGQFEVEVLNKKLLGWRNSSIAVESIISNYYEITTNVIELSSEEARKRGEANALAEVEHLIPETAHVLARKIEVLKTAETNLVRVKVNIETVEDIGQFMNY